MAVGQAVLSNVLDVGAVDAVEARLADREAARHAAHADGLRDALELNLLYEQAGLGLGVPAQLALVWRCSETRATTLLRAALVLVELPGAFELLDAAVMTVEQSGAVARGLEPLEPAVRDAVWPRVAARLAADAEQGVQRPPARLTELIRTWAVQVDPAAAEKRRKQAQRQADVLFDRRDDGLVDVLLRGVTAPDAEACLSRITAGAAPFGVDDDRTAGQRRVEAAVDLLLGRTGRPPGSCPGGCSGRGDDGQDAGGPDDGGCEGASCGCPLGSPVPCGAGVTVLVPLATALGVGDVPAELAGYGPLEPDLLAALLAAGPELRAAWVDSDGVPVSLGHAVERPDRGDLAGVREALRRLVAASPGPQQPRHPDDHGPAEAAGDGPPEDGPPDDEPPDGEPPPGPRSGRSSPSSLHGGRRPRLLTRAHPVGTPGPYRPPARLQRFLAVRAPRCEWPGCGARAARCDLDHDVPWPEGPTCACNLGPLCRRHHRVKQLGWHKQRTQHGVHWTSPTGRHTLSPGRHPAVPRIRPAAKQPDALAGLSPLSREHELWAADPTDPVFDGLDAPDDGCGEWQRADRATEQLWWAGQLAALRRQVHNTPHD
jgi:hypothetical protein